MKSKILKSSLLNGFTMRHLLILLLVTTSAFAQRPVDKHGLLRVSGNQIVDKTGTPTSLAGNSLFWSTANDVDQPWRELTNYYKKEVVDHLAENWRSSIIRVAMGVKETWDGGRGYIGSPEAQKAKIKTVIDAAIDNGIYVIIDWHSHDAELYESEAIEFFTEMAELYGDKDNVLYEIYNEPIRQSWAEVKDYSEKVISAIRAVDPDNLIIVGSPTWSQDVDVASLNPINDVNTAYTLHFYSGTHKQGLRDKALTALNNGIALFATEWGSVDATGDGAVDIEETLKWMDFFKTHNISHVNWSISDKDEGSATLNLLSGIDGLINDELTEAGVFIKDIVQNWSANIINCSDVDCIVSAMKNAKPGDEIVVAPGTYTALEKDQGPDRRAARFYSDIDGDANNPIIIRAQDPANPPVFKGPTGRYDGYIMRILGDYWQLKNLILEEGSKGLVFDNASFGLIENVTVRNIAEEGIHLRDGSNSTLITGCNISNTGIIKPGFGEGIYIGSDKKTHDGTFSPDANNNTIENCIIGPNVAAEGIDVKEGTINTIIRNNTFSARGITGENSADAFIDLKGAYGFVYGNTFNLDGSPVIQAAIDFQDRGTNFNTGFRNAIFNNTFNLGDRADEIALLRQKGGDPSEFHFWNNKRVPEGPHNISDFTLRVVTLSCPDWNIIPCEEITDVTKTTPNVTVSTPGDKTSFTANELIELAVDATDSNGTITKVEIFNGTNKLGEDMTSPYVFTLSNLDPGNYTITTKVTDNDGEETEVDYSFTVTPSATTGGNTDTIGFCNFNTPIASALPTFNDVAYDNVYLMGNNGPDVTNIRRFSLNWNLSQKGLYSFAINTDNGVPDYYVDLKDKLEHNFDSANPAITITNSGIAGLDGAYWVNKDEDNFVMVSKTGNFTLYFSNNATAPACATLSLTDLEIEKNAVVMYPNPVNDILNISNLPNTGADLQIVDMQGKVIITGSSNSAKAALNVSNLETGVYVVIVTTNSFKKTMLLTKK